MPASHVATGTGSVGVLQQLVQASAGEGDEVVYAWRSFEAYPIVVQISGARSVTVPLTAGEHHDLDAMAGGDHRPDPAGARLLAEQPHRHRGTT